MTEDKKVVFSQVLQLEKTPMMTRDKPIVFRKVLQLEKTLILTGDKPMNFRAVLQLEQTLLVAFTFPGSDKRNYEGKQSNDIRVLSLKTINNQNLRPLATKLLKLLI